MKRMLLVKALGRFSLLLGVLLMGLSCRDTKGPEVQSVHGTPHLTLRLNHVDLSKKEILFEFTVTNMGPESLTIPNLREGKLEDVGIWGGFHVLVHDDGDQVYGLTSKRTPPLRERDLITLPYGESLSVSVNLAAGRMYSPTDPDLRNLFLIQQPGSYTATAYMNMGGFNEPSGVRRRLWIGTSRSNPVRFTIPEAPVQSNGTSP